MIGFRDDDEDEDSEGAYGLKTHSKPYPASTVAKTKEYSPPKGNQTMDLLQALKHMSVSDGEIANYLKGLTGGGSPFLSEEAGDEWDTYSGESDGYAPEPAASGGEWSSDKLNAIDAALGLSSDDYIVLYTAFGVCWDLSKGKPAYAEDVQILIDALGLTLRKLVHPVPTSPPAPPTPPAPVVKRGRMSDL